MTNRQRGICILEQLRPMLILMTPDYHLLCQSSSLKPQTRFLVIQAQPGTQ